MIQTQNGVIHLISNCTPDGVKYTFCNNYFIGFEIVNVLAISNTFDGCCSRCKAMYDEIFQTGLDHHIRALVSSHIDAISIAYCNAKEDSGINPKHSPSRFENRYKQYRVLSGSRK